MRIYARFKRLSARNKLGVLGAFASLVGLILTVINYGLTEEPSDPFTIVGVGDQSPAISAGRDVHVTYGEGALESDDPVSSETLTAELLRVMMPDMRGAAASPRYLDNILGVPIIESERSRTYEYAGHRIRRYWGDADMPSQFVIGPAEGSTLDELQVLHLHGRWGSISGRFGQLTIGELVGESWCKVSDWNHGANGRCFNFFEVECGGAQFQDSLYYRFGVDSCGFATEHLNEEAWALLNRSVLEEIDTSVEPILDRPAVRNATVNFFMVTDRERECPRGAGCS